jgi:hypothetical protein
MTFSERLIADMKFELEGVFLKNGMFLRSIELSLPFENDEHEEMICGGPNFVFTLTADPFLCQPKGEGIKEEKSDTVISKERKEDVRLYLDDARETPEGWERAFTASEAIELLKTGKVVQISFDHDLGPDPAGNGNDVVVWIEEAVALHGFRPPRIMNVHSSNATASERMLLGIASIRKIAKAKGLEMD